MDDLVLCLILLLVCGGVVDGLLMFIARKFDDWHESQQKEPKQ